jgi:hypothetical protein
MYDTYLPVRACTAQESSSAPDWTVLGEHDGLLCPDPTDVRVLLDY